MEKADFDIVIIGAGPGGYVAAIRAAQLKMRVAIVEDQHLGGICLNWGCIPTKALLRSAEVYRTMQHAKDYGLKCESSFSIKDIVGRSRTISSTLNKGVAHLLKKNAVTVIRGFAKLREAGGAVKQVSVYVEGKEERQLKAKYVILATGARAKVLPGLEPDGKYIWNYKDALMVKKIPKSMVVLGSGAIGIEFASFFNTFGCAVTIVEVQERILPIEDSEISALAQKSFEKQGVKIFTKTGIKGVKKHKGGVEIELSNGQIFSADCLLTAVGIVGNVENIGLQGTKIKVHNTHIQTNKWSETNQPGVFAIGDVAGSPWLAHKAEHEGSICVEKIAGVQDVQPLEVEKIIGCTYCYPQIASFGMTEREAVEKGIKVKIGRFPFLANGKAIALGETEGLIKTLFDATTGELLGVHMIGAEVTEIISQYIIAKNLETTEQELMHTVFPHPTLSEMTHESVLNAYGRSIHI